MPEQTRLIRTDASNPDFIDLVKELDKDLTIRDGEDHPFYDQFNKIKGIKYAVVVYQDEKPVACGALKELDTEAMEIKRMYTLPQARKKGYASNILAELEKWAAELHYRKCMLETGVKQPEAIGLYHKTGYTQRENYGPYAGVGNSLCFEKILS